MIKNISFQDIKSKKMARFADFASKNADQMMNVNMHVVWMTENPGLDSLLRVSP